jgi:DNA-binding transcriptional MerR regulator
VATTTADMTIEDLAAASGMTVRNIRAHRGRGLLPAPEVRDRVGYYGPDHLARLRLIAEMQAQGFNLKAIERLLEQTRGRPEHVMGLKQALGESFEAEQTQVVTAAELGERFGEQADSRALRQAVRLGVLVPLGDGRYEAPTPATLAAAEEVVARGVPLAHALAVEAKVRSAARSVAREFVRLFVEDVFKPFAAAGYPEERWAEVTESIERLRPLSSQVLLSAYQQTMGAEVEKAFGKELERLAGSRR